jgi:hypothetical protein
MNPNKALAEIRRIAEEILERLRDDKCEYCGGNADTCRCDGCRMCIGCKDPHWDLDNHPQNDVAGGD